MTLHELTADYLLVLEMAEDPDIDSTAVIDTLEGIEGAIEDKADSYAVLLKSLENDVSMLKLEEDRLATRRRAIEGNIKRIKQSLQFAMQETGKTKFKTGLFSFGIQKNPPSVVIDVDVSKVPFEYLIAQEPKIDKKQILSDLKEGKEIDFAHMEQGESLRIR